MKLLLIIFFITLCQIAAAGITVIDPTLIATNRQNSAEELFQMIVHELNQEVSIDQFEEFLKRHGDLEEPTAEAVFEAMLILMNQTVEHSTSTDSEDKVDQNSIFTSQGNESEVAAEITIADEVVGETDGTSYLIEAKTRQSIQRFQSIRDKAIRQKELLMQNLRETTKELQAAKTTSEVQKLTGLLLSINTQLAAAENDLSLAAQELMMISAHAANEKQIRQKQAAEIEKKKLRHALSKDLELFKIERP